MIIPIRCFTCGKVIANLAQKYEQEAKKIDDDFHEQFLHYFETNDERIKEPYKNIYPGYKKDLLDKLGLHRICCRRHMISNVDLTKKI